MNASRQGFQSVMGPDIEQFIAYKRALGRHYLVEEKTLTLFDSFLAAGHVADVSEVDADLIDRFLLSRPRPSPRSYNHLHCTVARLFYWLVSQGRLDRTPVQSRPKRATYQLKPYIFDAASALRLLDVARALPDKGGTLHRGRSYHAMFAILYGLGLRVSEVCRLQIEDVEFDRRLLVIRESKFNKSRLVPFGPRMEVMLKDYLLDRERRGRLPTDAPLFSLRGGRQVNPGTVSQTFHHIVPELSLDLPPGCAPPRLHDLRHSFAVGTLLRWYRSGINPQARLLTLATFLGHVDVNSTAVYLNITMSLLQEANRRFEAFATPVMTGELLL
jgi:site-specific recombinase XerD